MIINTLSRPEQAVVLAAALTATRRRPSTDSPADSDPRAVTALALLHGDAADRCQRADEELWSLPSEPRRHLLAALGRQLFAPLPAHLERAHPSWIEERLQAEPALLTALLADAVPAGFVAPTSSARAAPAPTQIRVLLCRTVLGGLPELPAQVESGGPPAALEELPSWSPTRLHAMLRRLGVLGLATWVNRTPELRKPLLARLPREDSRALRDELRRGPPALPSWPGPRSLDGAGAEEVTLRLGAELLGSGLTQAQRRPLALLLPRPLAQALLHAAAGLEADTLLELVVRADAAKEVSPP